MKTRIVKRPHLSFAERIYLPAILSGMGQTIRHFFGVVRDVFHWKT